MVIGLQLTSNIHFSSWKLLSFFIFLLRPDKSPAFYNTSSFLYIMVYLYLYLFLFNTPPQEFVVFGCTIFWKMLPLKESHILLWHFCPSLQQWILLPGTTFTGFFRTLHPWHQMCPYTVPSNHKPVFSSSTNKTIMWHWQVRLLVDKLYWRNHANQVLNRKL